LPAHHGHEQRGAGLIRQLCRRLKTPREYRDLAILVARFHGHCHRVAELKPETIAKLFEQADAYRRPARFEEFLIACEADMRGRTGFEQVEYPQAQILRDTLEAASLVKPEIPENLSGERIGRLLREARVQAIRESLLAFR
jgi:tRNA nucleotidyltransferase (CCA-adding enzyme)